MKGRWYFSAHPASLGLTVLAMLFMPLDQCGATLLAMVFHEGAHLLAMVLCGVGRCHVEWTPLGFVADAGCFSLLPCAKRCWIAAAGPLASAALATVAYLFARQQRFAYLLLTANLALLLINGLPALPLDGGRVFLALGEKWGFGRGAERILFWNACLLAAGMTGLGLYGVSQGVLNPTLLVMGPYLVYAARQSTLTSQMESIRQLEVRSKRSGMYPVESWLSIGPPSRTALLRAVRRCPENHSLLLHTVDPITGDIHTHVTEKQMIVKLLAED